MLDTLANFFKNNCSASTFVVHSSLTRVTAMDADSHTERMLTESNDQVIKTTRPFAQADNWRSMRETAVTLGCMLLNLCAARALSALVASHQDSHPNSGWLLGWAIKLLVLLPIHAGLVVRTFIIQHDCGHASFFTRSVRSGWRHMNTLVGNICSTIVGVGYDGFRIEHAWHHMNCGRLSVRSIDEFNSPMTVDEALLDLPTARARGSLISPGSVVLFGYHMFFYARKWATGFFPFHPLFRWNVDRQQIMRNLIFNNIAYPALHALLIWQFGVADWFFVHGLGLFFGGVAGLLLFFVQHNFEHTYYAPDSQWKYANVGLHGSSYVKLPALAAWFTGDIGLHHVHHLNSFIPFYRLEEARLAVPELASVEPMSWTDFKRCFTHVFWDAKAGCMVDLDEVLRRHKVLEEQKAAAAANKQEPSVIR